LATELRESLEGRKQDQARHAEALRALEQKQNEALADLRGALEEDTLKKVQELSLAHGKELAGRDRVFEQAGAAHSRALREARHAADEVVVALREELTNDKARALEETQAAHETQLAQLKRSLERSEQDAEKKIANVQRANAEALERALSAARNEMASAVADREARLQEVLARQQTDRRELEKQRDDSRAEMRRLSEQLAGAVAKIERHDGERARVQAAVLTANDELTAERRARSEEGRQVAQRVDELRAARLELDELRKVTDANRVELETQLAQARARERDVAANASRLTTDHAAAGEAFRRELADVKMAAEQASSQLVASQASVARIKREGAQAISALEGEVARVRGALERYQADLGVARTTVHRLEQSLASHTSDAARHEATISELKHALVRATRLRAIEQTDDEATTAAASTRRGADDGDPSRRIFVLERQLAQARGDVEAKNDALERLSSEQTEQIAEWQKAYDDVIARHAAEINDVRATLKQEIERVRLEAEEDRSEAGSGNEAIANANREEISKRWVAAERQHEATRVALEAKLSAALADRALEQKRIRYLEEQLQRTVSAAQADVDAELAALRAEVQNLRKQLERDRALLKRARTLLGRQLEEDGVDEEE
jgi:chromosome segregation ATPase